jgi:PKD repeat protein
MRSFFQVSLVLSVIVTQLLFNSPSLAKGSQPVNPQFPLQYLPGDDLYGGSAGVQIAPAIARGGDTLLVAWTDGRAQPAGTGDQYETANDIYGMRLDASGVPLDAVPFPITQAPGAQENPRISWNGTHWLVVFESNGLSGTGGYYEKHLAAVRVAPDGSVVDAAPIQIFNTTPILGVWSVASNGADWVVAFEGSAASNDLQVIKITAAGDLIQPATSLVEQTYYLRFYLNLAYSSGVYLMTWMEYYDTYALRFDENLNPLDSAPFILVPGYPLSALTANDSQFYIAWVQQMPDFSMAVLGSRVDTNGIKLDGSGDNISGANQPEPYTTTSVAWDGAYWRASWSYNSALSTARISSEGQVLDPGGVSIPGPTSGVTAGTSLGGVQVAWANYVNFDNDIITANISPANTAGANTALSTGAPMQIRSDVAAGSNGYMFAYLSENAEQSRVLAQPLDPSGIPLTPEPIELDAGSQIGAPTYPNVAWNGSLYLVAWAKNDGIYAKRLQQDGTLLDSTPILVMSGLGPADVAAAGDIFMVASRRFGYTPEVLYPIGARVQGSNGAVLDAIPVVLGASYTRFVAVTAFGDHWLAVSHATNTHDDSVGGTQGCFVDANGVPGVVFGIYGPYSMGGNGIIEVAAASNGTTALVLQSAELTSGVETDLVGVLVNANGSVQPSVNLTPWVGNQYRPRVAWDGSQYIAVYQEQKNRFAPWTMDQLDARSDLFGMRINASGTPIDPHGFAFSTSPIGETYPNVIAKDGVSLLSGSTMRNPAPFAAYRIGYQFFGANGNQPPVAVATGSASGGDIPLTVNFSSAGSTDPDGSLSGYLWDFGDGQSSTEANPTHTFTAAGQYVVSLTVTDNLGDEAMDTVAIDATLPNQLPVAVAHATPLAGPPPLDVTFTASGSYDPDGNLGNFHWEFSDGTDYWGPTAYNTFYTAGIYTALLTVFDSRGGSASTTLNIYVGQPNQAPVAVASANPTIGAAPLQVDFSSAGSHDPDGTLASFDWDFGDGGTSSQANPIHTYTAPGNYQATLTVTDNQDATSSDSVTINVSAAVYGVSASGDQTRSGKPGDTITYTLAVTNTGTVVDTFDVSAVITGSQWTTTAPAMTGALDPGQSTTLEVQVEIPLAANDGEQSQATIFVTSQGESSAMDSVTLSSTALVNPGVTLAPAVAAKSGGPGETVIYTLSVTNTSEVTHTFEISASGAWAVQLPATQVTLDSGQSDVIAVNVLIPASATNGEQDLTTLVVQALGQVGVSAWAELTTTVIVPDNSTRVFFPLAVKGSG